MCSLLKRTRSISERMHSSTFHIVMECFLPSSKIFPHQNRKPSNPFHSLSEWFSFHFIWERSRLSSILRRSRSITFCNGMPKNGLLKVMNAFQIIKHHSSEERKRSRSFYIFQMYIRVHIYSFDKYKY